MEYIIQQIVLKLAKKILENLEIGKMNLNELGEILLDDCKGAAREMVEAYAQELNQQIRLDKEGRKGRLVLKEKERKRTVLTELGTINIKRDYYYDKVNECYVSPLDLVIGMGKYERVTASVGAKLVETATEYSYERSAQIVTDGAVSRQTVRNQILKINVPENEPKVREKETKELHVFADEDHVHMQKPKKAKGKKGQIVPLVTVTEGINAEGKRHYTENPMSFVNEEFDTKELWRTVSGYIGKAYDVEKIEKIYLHADGGGWIKNGLEEYAQTVHVIDGFHIEKELKRIAGCFQGRNIRQRLHGAIEKENKQKADQIIQEMMDLAEDEKTEEKVKAFGKYLMNHWSEAVVRRNEEVPGSCTEGQVSHLLAKRFSRDPMGWSKAGLGKLSAARIYVKNGGKLSCKDFAEKEDGEDREEYARYAEQMINEVSGNISDWSIFAQTETKIFDLASGTQRALHQIGSWRNVLS